MEQIYNGKLTRPSDNPVNTVLDMRFKISLSANEQYNKNSETALAWMNTTHECMDQIDQIVQNARGLIVKVAEPNTNLTYEAAAAEIDGLIKLAVQIGNTTVGDRYIFGGQADRAGAPFAIVPNGGTIPDASTVPETYTADEPVNYADGNPVKYPAGATVRYDNNTTVLFQTDTTVEFPPGTTTVYKAGDTVDYLAGDEVNYLTDGTVLYGNVTIRTAGDTDTFPANTTVLYPDNTTVKYTADTKVTYPADTTVTVVRMVDTPVMEEDADGNMVIVGTIPVATTFTAEYKAGDTADYLAGDTVVYPAGTTVEYPTGAAVEYPNDTVLYQNPDDTDVTFPSGSIVVKDGKPVMIPNPNPNPITVDTVKYYGDNNKISMVIDPGSTNPSVDGVNITGNELFNYDPNSQPSGFKILDDLIWLKELLTNPALWSSGSGPNDDPVPDLSGEALTRLDKSHDILLTTQARVSAKVSMYQFCQDLLEAGKIRITDNISQMEDPDIGETSTAFNNAQNAYNATLAMGAKLLPMSLVDFLR